MTREDAQLIEACLAAYRECLGIEYRVVGLPDAVERNRKACDALAEAPGVPPLLVELSKVTSHAEEFASSRLAILLLDPLGLVNKTLNVQAHQTKGIGFRSCPC